MKRPAMVVVFVLLGLCAACEPVDRRPGTWLSGEVVPTPERWAFTDDHQEIFVETATWYGVPHSVTTVVAARGSILYVPSIYEETAEFPGSKRWNKNIVSDPDVRLKIGESIYQLRARPVSDDDEFQRGYRALADKYDFWKQGLENPERRPPFVIIAMEARH